MEHKCSCGHKLCHSNPNRDEELSFLAVTNEEIYELNEVLIRSHSHPILGSPYKSVKCGLKSNIPICCILFYITFWHFLFLFMRFGFVWKFIRRYPIENDRRYVPCFMCYILNKKSKLHKCSEDDITCCRHSKIS